jgi:hypothetical protein
MQKDEDDGGTKLREHKKTKIDVQDEGLEYEEVKTMNSSLPYQSLPPRQ